MASYPAKRRDPLLDQKTQVLIERRGKELVGLALMAASVAVAMMLASYTPDDPSWLSATDAPAQNWLGRIGAGIASPLHVIAGWGAWGIAAVCLVWGGRFLLHIGEERVLPRIVFAPIAIALGSVLASTHLPPEGWSHSFGLGGLFGDTVLGAILGVLPVGPGIGLKLLALSAAVSVAGMYFYVLGFDRRELSAIGRFLVVGLVLLYDTLLAAVRGVILRTAGGAVGLQGRLSAARAARRDARLVEAEPVGEDVLFDTGARSARAGLLARLPVIGRKMPEPELVEAGDVGFDTHPPSEDRVRSRIADAIRSRIGAPAAAEPPLRRAEPPVLRGARVEPPVIAGGGLPPAPPPLDPDAIRGEPLFLDEDDDDWDPYAAPLAPQAPPPAGAHSRVVVQPAAGKAPPPSRRAVAERQPTLFDAPTDAYDPPPLSLLSSPSEVKRHTPPPAALEENARMLESVLDDYGVKGEIVSVKPGPVVTMYELEPAPGLKASRVIGLADDIARSMSALSARVSTVPGRSVIGIELPNQHREKVVLREILSARDFGDSQMRLPLALGKDIAGEPIVANLAKMPHLLIAGTTGSGKSVAINTMILSLLYKLSPEECRLIMIDPKMLELSVYDGIPHLLSPVVTDPRKAVVALKWVVGEMEERYRKMSKMGVRNIEGFNGRVREALDKGEMFKRTVQTGFDEETGDPVFETEEFAPEALPYIVVIVDEMADLMMVAGKEIEACIQRLAQMARASGIHLIMATQRPSVDVITGTIKANFPTRISFQVTSKIDSRTILGEMGAEQLLGQGDMLYMAGGGRISRVHGPFVSDEEVEEIVTFLKAQGEPTYVSGVLEGPDGDREDDIDVVLGLSTGDGGDDVLYDQAVAVVLKDRKVSTSYIQRKLGIGYNKAARLVEQMEEQGLVSSANHVGKREILVPEQ